MADVLADTGSGVVCRALFARVLLSTFPYYYEAKLGALIWLVWRSGADTIYRKLRRVLEKRKVIHSDEVAAQKELEIMQTTGKIVIERRLDYQASVRGTAAAEWETDDWEYDYEVDEKEQTNGSIRSSTTGLRKPDPIQQLYELSKFILSAEGAKRLEESKSVSRQNKMLLIERAASVVSFQPRFLRLGLIGTAHGPEGQLPAMDRNGLCDPYVTCRLVPEEGHKYPKRAVERNGLQNSDPSVESGAGNSPQRWIFGLRWVFPLRGCGGHYST